MEDEDVKKIIVELHKEKKTGSFSSTCWTCIIIIICYLVGFGMGVIFCSNNIVP